MTKGRVVAIVLFAVLVATLAYIFRNFIREAIVMPVAYLLWSARLLFESLPQIVVWIALLLVAFVLAIGSLIPRIKPRPRTPGDEAGVRGQVETLARRIDLAKRGYYFRWHLAQRLSELAIDVLAQRQRASREQIRQQLLAGALDIPDGIRAYLNADLTIGSAAIAASSLRQRLRLRLPSSPLDLDPESVVSFLEIQMAVATGEQPAQSNSVKGNGRNRGNPPFDGLPRGAM